MVDDLVSIAGRVVSAGIFPFYAPVFVGICLLAAEASTRLGGNRATSLVLAFSGAALALVIWFGGSVTLDVLREWTGLRLEVPLLAAQLAVIACLLGYCTVIALTSLSRGQPILRIERTVGVLVVAYGLFVHFWVSVLFLLVVFPIWATRLMKALGYTQGFM